MREMKYYRVQDRNILQITKRMKDKWIHHLSITNCLPKHVTGKRDREKARKMRRKM